MKKLIKYVVLTIVFAVSALSIFHLIQSNKIDENTVD